MDNKSLKGEKLLNIIKQLDYEPIAEDVFIKSANKIFNKNQDEIQFKLITEINENFLNSDEHTFIIYDPNGKFDINDVSEAAKKALEYIRENNKEFTNKKINIIEIFDSIKQRHEVIEREAKEREVIGEKNIPRSKEIRKKINEHINDIFKEEPNERKYSITNIKYSDVVISNVDEKNVELQIKISDRVRSLEQEYCLKFSNDKDGYITIKSYVFTASLNSIVELYNIFGDNLFSKNVRIGGIEDYIGVDDSIKKTYERNPEAFWFLNNGISLLVESYDSLDMNVFDRIKLRKFESISIINGAQTVKAVSEMYLKDKNISDKANVLLRLYFYKKSINDKSEKENMAFREFSEEVTVSLNKQKPIKQADLAYMTNFVKNIQIIKNNYQIDNEKLYEFVFDFVRRGEVESTNLYQYQLESFAKIVKSYLLKKPGEARNQAYTTLLRVDKSEPNDAIKLVNDDIFKQDFQEVWDDINDINDKISVFRKYYAPVNFAMKLKKYLSEYNYDETGNKTTQLKIIINKYYNKKYSELEKKSKIILDNFSSYGILIMVSAVINIINKFNSDFLNWEYSSFELYNKTNNNILKSTELEKIMEQVLDYVVDFGADNNFDEDNEENNPTDSNFWKKDIMMNFIEETYREKHKKNV